MIIKKVIGLIYNTYLNQINVNVIKIIDLTGREVNEYYKGWVVIYYDNREIIKTYQ
jgi:hypothetical protein